MRLNLNNMNHFYEAGTVQLSHNYLNNSSERDYLLLTSLREVMQFVQVCAAATWSMHFPLLRTAILSLEK